MCFFGDVKFRILCRISVWIDGISKIVDFVLETLSIIHSDLFLCPASMSQVLQVYGAPLGGSVCPELGTHFERYLFV